MVARSFRQEPSSEQQPEAADGRARPAVRRCAYCVPADEGQPPDARQDDCLIKMLGTAERKQVSLTLYRKGRSEGLFTQQCPMSADASYDACPFYEDESEIPEE